MRRDDVGVSPKTLNKPCSKEDQSVRHTNSDEQMSAWVVDYSEARARAIAWLGDRYLLARPVRRRQAPEPNQTGVNTAIPDSSWHAPR